MVLGDESGLTLGGTEAGPSAGRWESVVEVEQPIPRTKPYVALLQLSGEKRSLIKSMLNLVVAKLEELGQPPESSEEEGLRILWYELDLSPSTSVEQLHSFLELIRDDPEGHFHDIVKENLPGSFFSDECRPPGVKRLFYSDDGLGTRPPPIGAPL
jgi:hypothetical protein